MNLTRQTDTDIAQTSAGITPQITGRLHNLDYLRGLAAFGIMIYHYHSWTYGSYASDTFIGRVGVYGVSIFYVLSGLTLYHVYHHKMVPTKSDLLDFVQKRFFRIFPLLWLATIASMILSRNLQDVQKLLLNLTGLFGFVQWDAYIATGAWSIGNELVFYAFFPVFIFLARKSKFAFTLLSVILFSIYLHFAFNILDENNSLAAQWKDYVNPLNQVFLFLGGFIIGLVLKNITIKTSFNLLILITGLGLFVFYPADENTIHLVTGVNRIIFTLSCFLICLSFYKLRIEFPSKLSKPLTLLGEASYSVYLLHPVVYSVFKKAFAFAANHSFPLPEALRIIAAIIVTLILSYLVYEYFEKYFMRKGREMRLGKTVV